MKTINPSNLGPSSMIFNHIASVLTLHPLPWRAAIIIPSFDPQKPETATWGLVDREDVPALICVDKAGALMYQEFLSRG
ncbi:MAG: hypothetical protein WC735_01530 [Candidatus Paceibacterota bacterium]